MKYHGKIIQATYPEGGSGGKVYEVYESREAMLRHDALGRCETMEQAKTIVDGARKPQMP